MGEDARRGDAAAVDADELAVVEGAGLEVAVDGGGAAPRELDAHQRLEGRQRGLEEGHLAVGVLARLEDKEQLPLAAAHGHAAVTDELALHRVVAPVARTRAAA